jgi:hypothetical protein
VLPQEGAPTALPVFDNLPAVARAARVRRGLSASCAAWLDMVDIERRHAARMPSGFWRM